MRTPSRVRLVSAIEVARTSLRRPGGAARDARRAARRDRGCRGGGAGRRRRGSAVEPLGGPLDLGDARAGRRAGCPRPRRARGGWPRPSRPRSASRRTRPRWTSVDRVGCGPRFRSPARRPSESEKRAAVERRRHGEQPQIGPQRRLRVERQREAEIAVEAALVDLVEQHGRDARRARDRPGCASGKCLR